MFYPSPITYAALFIDQHSIISAFSKGGECVTISETPAVPAEGTYDAVFTSSGQSAASKSLEASQFLPSLHLQTCSLQPASLEQLTYLLTDKTSRESEKNLRERIVIGVLVTTVFVVLPFLIGFGFMWYRKHHKQRVSVQKLRKYLRLDSPVISGIESRIGVGGDSKA